MSKYISKSSVLFRMQQTRSLRSKEMFLADRFNLISIFSVNINGERYSQSVPKLNYKGVKKICSTIFIGLMYWTKSLACSTCKIQQCLLGIILPKRIIGCLNEFCKTCQNTGKLTGEKIECF